METMTAVHSEKTYDLNFKGEGGEYFGIVIVNWLFTVLTIGLYYPWAKAKELQYLYGATSLNNDFLTFHGTGKEMFKGFIKAILIFLAIYGSFFFCFVYLEMPVLGTLILYGGLLLIIPLAIHGSYRYRMSRTSWRGIRFGYRGNRNELFKKFFIWIFLTVITFGIYGAWMTINLRNYVLSNVRFGNLEFRYEGNGLDFLILNIKGYFLSIFTLGIYFFWWQKDLFNYYVDHLTLHHSDTQVTFKSTASGGDFFALLIVNLLILVFSLGLGYAWVVTRTMKFAADHIELSGDIDLDNVVQTEENFTDATGEDIGDMLDIDFIF